MQKNIFKFIMLFTGLLSILGASEKREIVPLPPVYEKSLHVYLIGTGTVGGSLLDQIQKNHEKLSQQFGTHIKIMGLANSRKMCFDVQGIALDKWRFTLDQSDENFALSAFVQRMLADNSAHIVFVDCTSDQNIANSYLALLESGISIVTPNKKANSGSFEIYQQLQNIKAQTKAKFIYDANVGAGLPILSTIQDLRRSGDEIVKIEAILSGTLSYLFNTFEPGMLFSEIVQDAQRKGYTEPDPRDDLNGMDMARKLLIIARESGFPLEMSDIQLQRFLPRSCFEASSVQEFYAKLKEHDAPFARIIEDAHAQGKRLRYIASFEKGKGVISLQTVGSDHPFYHLSGNDNIIAITTDYYSRNPLVIQGPGAGADVTAAKVLAGIIQAGL